jgi:zinc transport system substrate-binding protein
MRWLLVALVALAAAGCSGDETDGRPTIVASFYPLAWVAEQIAADDYRIVNLTPAGAEPHDIELSPRDIETIRDAEAVFYLGGGFMPALEDAVAGNERAIDLLDHETPDPHVWLDPLQVVAIALSMAAELEEPDTVAVLAERLRLLHERFLRGLRSCERREVVTTHAAFGHLAERYGLTELSLAGRSPEVEPGPRELVGLVEDVRASGATTVFAEPLVSSRLAETVAREAGVEVGVLDPIEGLSKERLAAGEDYFTVMRANLAALREALGCR